jgi:hypothetical protein
MAVMAIVALPLTDVFVTEVAIMATEPPVGTTAGAVNVV